MQTLFDRLKPEVKALLEKEKESYQNIVKATYNTLQSKYYITNLPYGLVLQLRGLEGMEDVSPFDMFEDRESS